MRIDKIICDNTSLSRSEIKKLIKNGSVKLNGRIAVSPDEKADESDEIVVSGKKLVLRHHIYLMLNKPKGYVSATEDKDSKTVLDLVPEEYKRKGIFPAGRLDKDTTGFVLLTDDGDFAHRILSPKHHVEKTYIATLDSPVTNEMISGFEKGVTLYNGDLCLSAELKDVSKNGLYLAKVTLREGMYHQIKRMFGVFGAGVNELKRISIGGISLDTSLSEGECREMSQFELNSINNSINS